MGGPEHNFQDQGVHEAIKNRDIQDRLQKPDFLELDDLVLHLPEPGDETVPASHLNGYLQCL